METKACTCCGKELSLNQFNKNSRNKDKRDTMCKGCRKQKTVATYSKVTQPGIKATFRISDFEDNQLFAELRRRGYTGELHYSRVVTV